MMRHHPFTVEEIVTGTAVIPLAAPLHLGDMVVSEREYTAVRVTDAQGRVGKAYCLSRSAPLPAIIDRMFSGQLVGQRVDDLAATWTSLFRASAISGRVGLVRKALGLVDIALWDLAAQGAGVPVWKLVGAGNEPRDVIGVASYPTQSRTADDIVDEVMAAAVGRWRYLKISRSPDVDFMREVLDALDRTLPSSTGLVVDVGFAWREADHALSEIAGWGRPRLAWIEDPLLPEDVDGCAAIRRHAGYLVAAGDEVTDPDLLSRLVSAGAVDALRLDVPAIGGITPALTVVEMARRADVGLSCHVYPEISVHLGPVVETFTVRSGVVSPYDPAAELIIGGPHYVDGRAVSTDQPGLGFDLDWSRFQTD